MRRFAAFWYDFIVGDDWLLAVGTLAALLLTALIARTDYVLLAWLILPIASVVILWLSLERATRQTRASR